MICRIALMVASTIAAVALVATASPAEASHLVYPNKGRPSIPAPGPQCGFLPCTPEPVRPSSGFPGHVAPCFQEPCLPALARAAHRN